MMGRDRCVTRFALAQATAGDALSAD